MIDRRTLILLLIHLTPLVVLPQAMANQIVEINGSAAVRRNGTTRYQPATVGTLLNRGDLIRPAARARVIVLCSNNTTWRVPAGVPSGLGNGCPDARSRFDIRGRGEDDFLAFLNQQFTYATQIMSDRPQFRWDGIDDATVYQVEVTDSEGSIRWSTTVEATTATYSGLALLPGRTYTLQVTPVDRPNAQPFRLVFRRVNATQAAAVQTTVDRLKNADLTPTGQAIATAQIYQSIAQPNTLPPEGTGLAMEAIPLLETAAQSDPTPYLRRSLGDLYLQVGLLTQAETQYQQAIAQPSSPEDLSSQAAAQVGLANIAAARGDRDQAKDWLQQASRSYAQLGAGDRVSLIGEWLQRL